MTAATMHLRVTQRRVIRSEWIKFWSLRSTVVTIVAALAVVVGIGLLAAQITHSAATGGAGGRGPADPTDVSLAGVNVGQLLLGTLGVLFTATEYTTGMIRSTLAAVPKRLPVLWGKAAVFAAVVFPLTLAAALTAFLGGQALLGDQGVSLSDPGVLRAVVGSAVYLTGAGLLGLALGSLLRSTAAAVSTLFGVMFLLPGVSFLLLPASWQHHVSPYLPSAAGSAFTAVQRAADHLAPWPGLAVFVGYLVVLGAAAAWRLKRHDA